MERISKSVEETAQIAADFAKSLSGGGVGATVVGLYGELGSGKTTFMKYLAQSFGIEEMIKSPTFVIEKIYKIAASGELQASRCKHLIHIDAYRIEKEEEMINLGWREIIADPKNLICVEWPEKIEGIMPGHIKIFFEHVSESERKIKIEKLPQ